MTLESENTKVTYNGDGATVSFPITFVFWANSDIKAILRDADGDETVWVLGTEYTLSGGDGETGTLTVSASPTDYTPASGEKLVILSDRADTQPAAIPAGGPLPSTAIEQALDQTVRIVQQKEETLGRALKFSQTSPDSAVTMPDITGNASKVLRVKSDESGLEMATVASLSDGTPVVVSDDTPEDVATTGSAGTSEDISRADHVHGLPTIPVAKGGTGATTAAGARAELGAAALGANTFTGAQNLADNELTRPKIKDYGETINALGSIGGGSQDIDLTLGNVVSGTVDTSETTFTFSNPPATGTAGSFTLILTNGGSQTVNWPGSVDWPGGTAPELTASGIDILTFMTLDGGTVWYGFASGTDMQ